MPTDMMGRGHEKELSAGFIVGAFFRHFISSVLKIVTGD